MIWFGGSVGVRLIAGALFFGVLALGVKRHGRGVGWKTFGVAVIALGAVFALSPGLEAAAFVPLLAGLAWVEWRQRRHKTKPYVPAIAKVEGGGVKRGLSAPEAAALLGKPFNVILTLALFGMLRKGMLEQVSDRRWVVRVSQGFRTRDKSLNPERRGELRRGAAQEAMAVLQPYEEPILELLEQNEGKAVVEVDYGIVVKPLLRQVVSRAAGFDMEETEEYYRLIIRRAPKEARSDGVLVSERQKVFDRNFEWILLHEDFEGILEGQEFSYAPVWLRPPRRAEKMGGFAGWASEVMAAMKAAIPPEALQIKLGQEMDGVTAKLLGEISRATFYG